jgi:lipopolysaccharide transport system permease protein
LILGLFIWFQIPLSWSVLLAPVALIHLILLGTAIGLFLVPIGSLYGDIPKILAVIVTPWLLLTPVIYPVPKRGWFGAIVNINPVTPLLVTTRELATTGVVSDPTGFWVASGGALVVSVMNFSPLSQGKRIAESREEEVMKASSHEHSRTRTADPTGQSHQFSA